MSTPESFPRTREELLDTHLSEDDIVQILASMKKRAIEQGDVMAAKLLYEIKYGKNPEPPNTNTQLEDLLMEAPLSDSPTDSM